jgi:1-acyl-sn-glycerol-3-phosphate acyltransferase
MKTNYLFLIALLVRTMIPIIVYTLLLCPLIIIAAPFSRNRVPSYHLGRFWSWLILKTNRVKLVTHGMQNLLKKQSYVYISNHLSHLDTPALAVVLPNQLRFVAKASLQNIPLFGFAAKTAKMIFIDRNNSEKSIETINNTIEDLKNGISVLFFGEGTRSLDGIIKPMKKGGVILALKAGLPIVPITIVGSDRLLGSGKLYVKSGIIKIIAGDPIDTKEYSEQTLNALIEKTQSVILANYKKHALLPSSTPTG